MSFLSFIFCYASMSSSWLVPHSLVFTLSANSSFFWVHFDKRKTNIASTKSKTSACFIMREKLIYLQRWSQPFDKNWQELCLQASVPIPCKIILEHTNWPGQPKILRNFINFNHLCLKNTVNWAQTKASPTKSHCQLEVGPANLAIQNNLPK